MKRWVLAAGLFAVAFVPFTANAADPGDDEDDRRGTYNEPRRKGQPPPTPGYNDQDDDDDDRPPPGKRYSGPPPGAPPANRYWGPPSSGPNCVRSEQVRQRLTEMGWQDFQDGRPQGEMVMMKARRPSGRQFELTLHRCSGQLVEVRPLEGRPSGPYAFNNRPYNNPDAYDAPRGPYGYGDRWRNGPYANGGPRRWWRDDD
jgi:hypothetical protein